MAMLPIPNLLCWSKGTSVDGKRALRLVFFLRLLFRHPDMVRDLDNIEWLVIWTSLTR